jgi:heme exporter protein D
MSNDPHFGFVIAAYGLGFFILGGMTLTILREYLSLKRMLSEFAARPSAEGSEDSKFPGKSLPKNSFE